MASWSDLPTELRAMVFHRIFYQTVFRYSNPKYSFGRQTTNQVLGLILVSKSFARGDDVVTAMTSEAILWLEYDEHITDIVENPKYGNHLLTQVRKLQQINHQVYDYRSSSHCFPTCVTYMSTPSPSDSTHLLKCMYLAIAGYRLCLEPRKAP